MQFQKVGHQQYTGILRASIALLVLCLAFSAESSFGETLRKVEAIDGYWYTVKYTVEPDGGLHVDVTDIYTTNGWESTSVIGKLPFDPQRAEKTGRIVDVGDKKYTVRFSSAGKHAAGDAYAIADGVHWKYLEKKAVTPDPQGSPQEQQIAQAGSVPLAEFRLYENLIGKFRVTAKKNENFLDNEGHTVIPDADINVRSTLLNSAHTIATQSNIDVNARSKSTGSRLGPLGNPSGATVYTQMTGGYTKEVHGSPQGSVSPGRLKGGVRSSYQIAPFSQAIIGFRGIARGQALQEAQASVTRQIPIQIAKLEQQINQGADEAVNRANQEVQTTINKLSGFGPKPEDGISLQLSTRATQGNVSGYVSAKVLGTTTHQVGERPELKNPEKMVSSLFINEDALTQAVTKKLPKEETNLKKGFEQICANDFLAKLDICDKKAIAALESVSVKFDEKDPFSVSFRDNQIKIEINALHDDKKLTKKTGIDPSPYRIEIVYDVKPEGLVRKSLRATPQTAGQDALAARDKATHGAEPVQSGLGGVINFFGKVGRAATDSVESTRLIEEYSKGFKDKVTFPQVKIPATASVLNPAPGVKPTVTSELTLASLDAQTANGWLGLSSQIVGQ